MGAKDNLSLTTYVIIGVVSFLVVILYMTVCGVLSKKLYQKKGYVGGFWIGFLLGLIGLVFAAGLPLCDQVKEIPNEQKENSAK